MTSRGSLPTSASRVAGDRITEARLVLPLEKATDPNRCGRKAAALADLHRSGERVPAGFVITADAAAIKLFVSSSRPR